MAAPHVAGVAALLLSAAPDLRGNVAEIEAILRETARPMPVTESCGSVRGDARPNNTSGYGAVDAVAAVAEAVPFDIRLGGADASGARAVTLTNRTARPRTGVAIIVRPEAGPAITLTVGTIGAAQSETVSVPLAGAPAFDLEYQGLVSVRRASVSARP